MMAVVTDVVQQLNEKNSSRMQSVLENYCATTSQITKALKQILACHVSGICSGGTKSNKQHIDPNKHKCKNCNRVHKNPDSECWKLPENKDKTKVVQKEEQLVTGWGVQSSHRQDNELFPCRKTRKKRIITSLTAKEGRE